MKIQLVIFDMDGTILNSLDDIGDSMNKTLAEFSMPTHPVDAYKMFVGSGARNLTINAMPEDKRGDHALIDRVFARYREIYKDASMNKTAPYDGIIPLLKALEQKNVSAAVLSNKPHDDTCFLAKTLFPGVNFAAVYGQRENVRQKPDPEGALLIAKELDIPTENCLYVGDSGVDMKTGKAAGMTAVGVLWGFRDEIELKGAGSDILISRPDELLALLVR